jgi:hypothetical protein
VVTAYLLTSTAVTPLWGRLSDLYAGICSTSCGLVWKLTHGVIKGDQSGPPASLTRGIDRRCPASSQPKWPLAVMPELVPSANMRL